MKTGITSVKDVDRLILDATDDTTLLKLLQVNRNLLNLGEEAFKRRMQKFYPELIKLKPKNQTWGKYYISTVYYISKLKEDYNIDYIPVSSFNPSGYYTYLESTNDVDTNLKNFGIAKHMAEVLAETGNEKLILNWMDKNKEYEQFLLAFLLKYRNIALFEKLYRPNNKYLLTFNVNVKDSPKYIFAEEAAESGDKNIIDYILNKFKYDKYGSIYDHNVFDFLVNGAAKSGNFEMLEYASDKFPKYKIKFERMLTGAAEKGQIEFIEKFIIPANYSILIDNLPHVIQNLLYSDITEIISPHTKKNTLRFLLNTYFEIGGKKKKLKLDKPDDPIFRRILKEYNLI